MPIDVALGTLTLFLVLSYLLPGITILSSTILLFPGILGTLKIDSPFLITGIILVVAYLHGFPAILAENLAFDWIWEKCFPRWQFAEKLDLVKSRSEIIAKVEAYSISHAHYDQTLGEFILFFNTGLWIAALSLAKLIMSVFYPLDLGFYIAWPLLVIAGISLFYVSPLFKKRYLDILAILQAVITKKGSSSGS